MCACNDGGWEMSAIVKYNTPLHILAETHGMSVSTLERRLRAGMSLHDALSAKIRSREVTKQELLKNNHLTFTEACTKLGISSRKLNRLCAEYDIYFRRVAHTQDNEGISIIWIALHSPVLKMKHMVRFVNEHVGFEVTECQLKNRFYLLGFGIEKARADLEKYKAMILDMMWGKK